MNAIQEDLTPGKGGWVRYQSSALVSPVFVRFGRAVDGRLVTADLFVPDLSGAGLDGNLLRKIPTGRIEAWVNHDEKVRRYVDRRIDEPGPDLRDAVSHWSTTAGPAHKKMEPRPLVSPIRTPAFDESLLKLEVPERRPFGEQFYRDYARVHAVATVNFRDPAGAIADANGVSTSQVHRWTRRARDLTFITTGRAGKS